MRVHRVMHIEDKVYSCCALLFLNCEPPWMFLNNVFFIVFITRELLSRVHEDYILK